jgi:hypothetical protein
VRRLLVRANVAPSSPILVTLIIEELGSSETPFLTRATHLNTPDEGILHSHRRENLKFDFSSFSFENSVTNLNYSEQHSFGNKELREKIA